LALLISGGLMKVSGAGALAPFSLWPLKWPVELLSPLGNASADDCANYCVSLFSDLTKMVTMQNLFHDGGYSTTGVSNYVMEKLGVKES